MRTSQKGLKRVETFIVETDGPNKWIADVTCFKEGFLFVRIVRHKS